MDCVSETAIYSLRKGHWHTGYKRNEKPPRIGGDIKHSSTAQSITYNNEGSLSERQNDEDDSFYSMQRSNVPGSTTCFGNRVKRRLSPPPKFKDSLITRVQVAIRQYPRSEYAVNNIADTSLRYGNIIRMDGDDNVLEKCISFYFFDMNQAGRDIILADASEASNVIKITKCHGEECVISEETSLLSCLVVAGSMEQIDKAVNNSTTTINLILAETPREKRVISRRYSGSGKTFVIYRSNIQEEIDKIVEKYLLRCLSHVYVEIRKDNEKEIALCPNDRSNSADNCKKTKDRALRSTDKRKIIKLDGDVRNILPEPEQSNGYSILNCDLAKDSKVISVAKNVLSTLNKNTKKRLLEELIGVFHMSETNIEDMLKIPKYKSDKELKEISRVLFTKFKEIYAIGCRMNEQKLTILLKDGHGMDARENEKLEKELIQLNVHGYVVVPMSLKKHLATGDELVFNGGFASFGCFAKAKNENESTYGILSKHVAMQCQTDIYVKEGCTKLKVGRIKRKTLNDGGPDIAAAKLTIPFDQCDTRFKSAKGSELKSNKLNAIPTYMLEGQRVHMWGAKSKPGKGIITVANFKVSSMDHSLIQVEDIQDVEGRIDTRFAQPGDSGAIACTDHPSQELVNPISMNVGCMNYKVVEEDDKEEIKKERGKYLTVPLHSGLQEIGKRIGKSIELC